MSLSSPATPAPLVLCVDDDAMTLRIVEKIVCREGYRVVTARSVEDAKACLQKEGKGSVDAIVSDYSMPGETGLDLVRWIRDEEPALAVILVTAAGDAEVIRTSLREGVVDFLDKPVKPELLSKALKKAVATTRQRREETSRAHAVRHVGDVHAQMLEISGIKKATRCRVFFRALRETGGDFVTSHPLKGANSLVLTADVSGHDLKDAYLGAVFQGMLRGFVGPETNLEAVFERLHGFLVQEWNPAARRRGDSRGIASIALCGLLFDEEKGTFRLRNSGQPLARLTRDGWTEMLGTEAPPLGWFDELESDDSGGEIALGASLVLWTDGLQDLAEHLNVDPLAAAYRLCPPDSPPGESLPSSDFTDDVLVLQVDLGPKGADPGACWHPLVAHVGNGSERFEIDVLQEKWERSLRLVSVGLSEAAIFDVLVCTREAAANAIKHGCGNDETKTWELQIHFNPTLRHVRVSVRDDGPGWPGSAYLTQPRDAVLPGDDERHNGIVLLRKLPSQVEIRRSGASQRFSFEANRPMTTFE